MNIRFNGYTIYRVQEAYIPYKWAYVHDDYDGAEDSCDQRFGYGMTPQECIDEIEELEHCYDT